MTVVSDGWNEQKLFRVKPTSQNDKRTMVDWSTGNSNLPVIPDGLTMVGNLVERNKECELGKAISTKDVWVKWAETVSSETKQKHGRLGKAFPPAAQTEPVVENPPLEFRRKDGLIWYYWNDSANKDCRKNVARNACRDSKETRQEGKRILARPSVKKSLS